MPERTGRGRKDFPSRLVLRRLLCAALRVAIRPSPAFSGERQPGGQLLENLLTLLRFKAAPSGNLLGFPAATPAKPAGHIDFAYADTGTLDLRFENVVGLNRHFRRISAQ